MLTVRYFFKRLAKSFFKQHVVSWRRYTAKCDGPFFDSCWCTLSVLFRRFNSILCGVLVNSTGWKRRRTRCQRGRSQTTSPRSPSTLVIQIDAVVETRCSASSAGTIPKLSLAYTSPLTAVSA